MSVGAVGATPDVLGERRVLAAPQPLGELLRQFFERVAIQGRRAHARIPPPPRIIAGGGKPPESSIGSERGREDLLEPAQGTDVALAGRGLVQAEHGGRLVVVQLLEVTERQDLAIDRVHGVERLLHLDLDLGPDGGPARRGQSAEELGGQRARVGGRQRAA